jgi:AcrR family transcriptional regulator
VATKLDHVANQAGVALPTLSGYFPNKPALLQAVLRSVVAGAPEQDAPPIGEQLTAALAIEDHRELLATVAHVYRTANERAFELFEIMRKAAAADPSLEQQRRDGAESRRRDQAPIARHLQRDHALRPGLTEQEATDILWVYSSTDLYRLLVHDSRWPPERYEQWLAHTLADALLGG